MVTIDDIEKWYTIAGVQHVVTSVQSGWTWTLCGSLCSGYPDEKPPAKLRVCRKCRSRLPEATKK